MFSDHKKLQNVEKHLIKNHKTLFTSFFKNRYVFYSITVKQIDKIFIEYMRGMLIEKISPIS